MTQIGRQKRKRRRGVILTSQGLKKFQEAKSEAEFRENSDKRYTLEALSERTGLSVDTLMKVFACEAGVDKQTLKCCFRAFNLVLETNDYFLPEPQIRSIFESDSGQLPKKVEPEWPEGQVPLDSAYYLERPSIEADCYKTIGQPGALLLLKAPKQMGKTSLMVRILDCAAKQGYQTVSLSFQLAEREIFQDLAQFLRWFCANVTLGLQLPNQLADYWDQSLGSKVSCQTYFEQYLLAKTTQPLVIGLDDVERLFQYPDLAEEFFGLLQVWHEQAKNRDIWKKLRLVVAHSTEVDMPLKVHQSLFNRGLPMELPSFTNSQVQDLAKRHGLDWSEGQAEQLNALVGGHPYLVRVALYRIWHQHVSLEQLLQSSTASAVIYRDHLQGQLWNLQQDPELAAAFAQVARASVPVKLDLGQAFQLKSMGLVHLQGNQAMPSCELYAQYFRDRLVAAKVGVGRFSKGLSNGWRRQNRQPIIAQVASNPSKARKQAQKIVVCQF